MSCLPRAEQSSTRRRIYFSHLHSPANHTSPSSKAAQVLTPAKCKDGANRAPHTINLHVESSAVSASGVRREGATQKLAKACPDLPATGHFCCSACSSSSFSLPPPTPPCPFACALSPSRSFNAFCRVPPTHWLDDCGDGQADVTGSHTL